ncbi:hypothetical protein Zmor_022443 [Zophobas morio]|uniref:Uncharacterized protein n=1 Tax=Zophobas morio TaxID=2755281 RepID=A0AA38M5Z5_9CUCU|nr:hypothetical protein Zmor_022443 [Zophobas morio]
MATAPCNNHHLVQRKSGIVRISTKSALVRQLVVIDSTRFRRLLLSQSICVLRIAASGEVSRARKSAPLGKHTLLGFSERRHRSPGTPPERPGAARAGFGGLTAASRGADLRKNSNNPRRRSYTPRRRLHCPKAATITFAACHIIN